MSEVATQTMDVDGTPELCFQVVADVESYPGWTGDIKAVTVRSRDGDGRPTEVEFRAAAFGRSTTYELAYDYSRSPKVLAWRLVKGDLTSKLDGSYTFDSREDGGTELTYVLDIELKVPLPGFVKRRAQSRIMHAALSELKARVESIGN